MTPANQLQIKRDTPEGQWDIEDKLFDILTAYLPPTSDLIDTQAAEEINSLFPDHRHDSNETEKESPESFLFEFWELMLKIAGQLDYEDIPMQRFVNLIGALRRLPNTTVLKGGGRVWQDLPHFAMYFSEEWNGINPLQTNPDDDRLRRWINLNGLLIHLSQARIKNDLYHTLGTIALCLENEETRTQAPQHLVPIAAKWFEVCGPLLHDACQASKCSDSQVHGQHWQGDPGYNMTRWGFWKERLGELTNSAETEDMIRERCAAALEGMDDAAC